VKFGTALATVKKDFKTEMRKLPYALPSIQNQIFGQVKHTVHFDGSSLPALLQGPAVTGHYRIFLMIIKFSSLASQDLFEKSFGARKSENVSTFRCVLQENLNMHSRFFLWHIGILALSSFSSNRCTPNVKVN
jgi:hypothetical protein